MRLVGENGSLVSQPIDIETASGIDVLQDIVNDTSPQLGGNLDVNGNKITSVSNGNIDIEPHGTGNVLIGNLTFDADQTVGAGQDNFVLTYNNSSGLIVLESNASGNLSNVVEDTTPQLGGNLDVNGQSLVTTSNGNIVLAPNGTGHTQLEFDNDAATSGPDLVFNRTSASPAADDLLGSIIFKGKDSAGNTDTYSSIVGKIERTNSGSERGRINFNCIANGSEETVMTMNRNGLFMAAGNKLALAGDTDNDHFVTLVTATDPTGFRAIGFPDADGTVVLKDTTDTLTNKTLTNPVISQIVSVSDGNIELDPNGTGKIILDGRTDINGNRTGASLFIDTDMSSDTSDDLANAIECQLDYTGSTIGSGTRQQSVVFKFKDDAVDRQAGRFTSEFTSTDASANKMKLIAIDHATSGAVNGQIDISPKRGKVNKPFELQSYTVADLPTAGIGAGAMAYVTNDAGGAVPCFYDGSAWRRVTDRTVCST